MTEIFECSVCGDTVGEPSRELRQRQYIDELLADPDVGPEFIEHAKDNMVYLESVKVCVKCGRLRCPSCEEWCCDG